MHELNASNAQLSDVLTMGHIEEDLSIALIGRLSHDTGHLQVRDVTRYLYIGNQGLITFAKMLMFYCLTCPSFLPRMVYNLPYAPCYS
jgi:hypothetical protein